jgi:hypothetical protein
MPAAARTEPLVRVTALEPRALLFSRATVPPLMVVGPVKPALLPERMVVPEADVMGPVPVRVADSVPPDRV